MSNYTARFGVGIACLAFVASGCGLVGLSPKASASARCDQGIDLFENARCGGIAPTATDRPTVEMEYQNLQTECTDTASAARIQQLGTCVAAYRDAEKTKKGKHDDTRDRYSEEVAAVKADPNYMPTLEEWALARDEAQIAEDDWVGKGRRSTSSPYYRVHESKKAALEDLNERMRQLLKKHGVDPKYASVLGLW